MLRVVDVFAEGVFSLLAEWLPEPGADLRGDEILTHETEVRDSCRGVIRVVSPRRFRKSQLTA